MISYLLDLETGVFDDDIPVHAMVLHHGVFHH